MKKTILYLLLALVSFLYGQTQLDWNSQLRNRPNITRTGSNATWTDNLTLSGTGTFSNTNTFTGAIQPKTFANVVYVQNSNPQGWTGSTPDAWITSAAGSGNIVIDARGLTGAVSFTGTAALPANTTIYFGLATVTCNTSPCFSYNNQVAIYGAGDNSTVFQGPNPNGLGGPLIAPANSANRTFDAIFRDFYLDNRNNATASGVCIDYSNMSRARTYNVGCANAQNGYKVGGTIAGFYNEFFSTWCLNPGTNCYNITTNGNSARITGGHTNGTGTNCMTIDGATDVRVLGFDAEQCTTGFNIAPTTATSGTGIQHVRLDTSITTGFNISVNATRTYIAGVYPAGVTTLLTDNATDTVFIVAHGDGHSPNFDVNRVRFGSTTTEFAQLYCQASGNLCFFRNPADSVDAQIRTGSITISSGTGAQFLEGTPAGGAANQTTCQASSTSHTLQCSYNNGTFFNITQTIANGTATMTTAAITAGNCGATVTAAASGTLTSDVIAVSFVTPAPAGSNAGLAWWPTANNVNFAYCPNTAETPAAATINWRVIR